VAVVVVEVSKLLLKKSRARVDRSVDLTSSFEGRFRVRPPTNYRTEFGYVLRCAEELTEDTPQIESQPWSLSRALDT
jgi:hypothetical protein